MGTRFDGPFCINSNRNEVTFFRSEKDNHQKNIAWHYINEFCEDRVGCIWIVNNDGICIYNPTTHKFSRTMDDSLRKHRPSNRNVYSIVQDRNKDLWMTIDHYGLMRIKVKAEGKYQPSFYSIDDLGFENANLTYMYPDRKGGIWINNCCLVHFNPEDFSMQTYSDCNGLHIKVGDATHPYIDNHGVVFVPAQNGYETADHLPESNTSGILNVFIEQFLIKGKRVPLGRASPMDPFRLNAGQNDLGFVFSAICFRNTGAITYSYLLQGYDKEWNVCINSREAKYTNLPPGRYQFIVRASYQGKNKVKEARISIFIPPFFWETWWFIILVIVSVATLLYLIYKYRMMQLLRLERLRTRIATDLHDEVSSTLSGISIMSEILEKEVKETRQVKMVSEIGNKSIQMMEKIDDIIWVVKPDNDRFRNLGLRIREFATPLFESKNIQYHFEIDEHLAEVHLSMEKRRNIYLIGKEAINNLIKYSDCSEAHIIFRDQGQDLYMEIRDNGGGFNPELLTSRNGLKNMRFRANQIHADIQIISNIGKGTRIVVLTKVR